MQYLYNTEGTCARQIAFELTDGKVTNVRFNGGCNGNLKAIAKLVDGWTVEEICAKLEGNTCGMKPTSCADQLCKALREAEKK